jgi:hypothetical protein
MAAKESAAVPTGLSGELHYDPSSTLPSLIENSKSGNLASVKQILENWLQVPDRTPARREREPFRNLQDALDAAVKQEQLPVASYLLQQGFTVTESTVKAAIEANSKNSLELLLQSGWDINDRWARYKFPSLW